VTYLVVSHIIFIYVSLACNDGFRCQNELTLASLLDRADILASDPCTGKGRWNIMDERARQKCCGLVCGGAHFYRRRQPTPSLNESMNTFGSGSGTAFFFCLLTTCLSREGADPGPFVLALLFYQHSHTRTSIVSLAAAWTREHRSAAAGLRITLIEFSQNRPASLMLGCHCNNMVELAPDHEKLAVVMGTERIAGIAAAARRPNRPHKEKHKNTRAHLINSWVALCCSGL
jgi:hypothetical protein